MPRQESSAGSLPLVSVIINNYNYARFISDAIESVLEQDYPRLELVICDDGSEDESLEIIERYERRASDKITTLTKSNGGQASALNLALRHARGEIVALLDSDDSFFPNKVSRAVDRFQANPAAGMVIHPLVKIDAHGRPVGLVPAFGRLDDGMLRDKILRSGGLWASAPTSGITMRKAVADRILPIPEEAFKGDADAYINTHLPLYAEVASLPDRLARYRIHSTNLRSTSTSIDRDWCDRSLAGVRRTVGILQDTARKEGFPTPEIESNPNFVEVDSIKHYLDGASVRMRLRDVRRISVALANYTSHDRAKRRARGALLAIAILLPRPLGMRIVDAVYLSNSLKRLVRRVLSAPRRLVPARFRHR